MEPLEPLEDYQAQLKHQGTDPAPPAAQADALASVPDSEFERAVQAFQASADRCDYAWDSDYGALLLENVADSCADIARRRRLYEEARRRAGWLAAGATSGGEGTARSIDWKRLDAKVKGMG